MWKTILAILIVLSIAITSISYAQQPPPPPPISEGAEAAKVAQWVRDLPAVDSAHNHFSIIGGPNFVHLSGNPEIRQEFARLGVAGLYQDTALLDQALQSLRGQFENLVPMLAEGGILYLRDVQNFPWGMIEIAPGVYTFDISDLIVQNVEAKGLTYVGTVMPFAAWDLATSPTPQTEMCRTLLTQDFYYLASGGIMGRYQDLDAFIRWLDLTVERYDGDGINDMPGLQRGIKYWQIHNEPEGDQCGSFRADPEAFLELMQRSYETIHASCADCLVLNGGAGIPLWREAEGIGGASFWREFAEMGGAQYVDVIAIHYNDGKHSTASEANLTHQITRLRELLGQDKPVWMTEFGVIVQDNQPGGGNFNFLSEVAAGAWYMRYYTVGLANGVERFFSDMPSFVTMQRKIFLPYYVNKLLEDTLQDFTRAERIAEGQYRFTIGDQGVYILWSGVPAEITGSVQITDMYGNQQMMDAAQVQPTEANPLIVEFMK